MKIQLLIKIMHGVRRRLISVYRKKYCKAHKGGEHLANPNKIETLKESMKLFASF